MKRKKQEVARNEPAAGQSGMVEDGRSFEHYQNTARTHTETQDSVVVPIHEEELTATKSAREIGQVRIEKDVISEEQRIDVPLTEERVRVNRVAVDRAADANDATAFEGGTIEVPIRGEEVQVHKDVRVTGEVEIDKEQVERTEQVGGTVRREEVRVSEDVVDVDRTQERRRKN